MRVDKKIYEEFKLYFQIKNYTKKINKNYINDMFRMDENRKESILSSEN